MKNIPLNSLRAYCLELRQHEWHGNALPKGPIFRLVGALGAECNPKLRPVRLQEEESSHSIYGLYSIKQARRQGRKRDLSDVFQVGGLIVDKTVAPANGAVAITHLTPDPNAEAPFPLPWTVLQILRTDGKVWQAFVDNGHGKWALRESIDIEPLLSAHIDYDAPPVLLTAFIEFMRRALLCWQDRGHPATLASYFASHAREENERLLRMESGDIAAFQKLLRRETGFYIEESRYAAHCLTAIRVFELLYAKIARSSIRSVIFDASADFVHWTRPSRPLADALTFLLKNACENFAFADDMWGNDHCLTAFCLCFLNETAQLRQHLDGFTFEHMSGALSQAMHVSKILPNSGGELRLCDPNAGHGDLLLAALYTLPTCYKEVNLIASEANPLGVQITRLRLEAAAQRPIAHTSHINFPVNFPDGEPRETKNQHKSTSFSTVRLGNIFRDGCGGMCETHESVMIGEVRPHIARGTALELDTATPEPSIALFGWGTKIQGIDYAATKYVEVIHGAYEREALLAASIRFPASWADEAEYAPARAKLCRDAEEIYVNTEKMGERPRDKRLARGDILILTSSGRRKIDSPPERYHRIVPRPSDGYSLLPRTASPWYDTWVSLPELALKKPLNGPVERRGMSLIDIDKARLQGRLNDYFSDMTNCLLTKKHPEMMTDTKLFNARETRDALLRHSHGIPPGIVDYSFRPFDVRFAAVEGLRPLFSEPANELFSLARDGGLFLVAGMGTDRVDVGVPAWFGGIPCDYDFFAGRSGHFPVWLEIDRVPRGMTVNANTSHVANISKDIRIFLEQLGYENPDTARDTAELIWLHALAVLYTPAYLRENSEALRLGWPRIPIPGFSDDRPHKEAKELLRASATLGRQVAELLSFENAVPDKQGLLAGRLIVDGRPVSPDEADPDVLALAAGWGIRAKGNAVRPRPGRISSREYKTGEEEELVEIAKQMGVDNLDVDAIFGCVVGDVYLNDRAYWSGVPEWSWEYRIGGRQVLPKWLSYRESTIINRPLTASEVRFFGNMVTRVIKLAILGVKLDALWADTW